MTGRIVGASHAPSLFLPPAPSPDLGIGTGSTDSHPRGRFPSTEETQLRGARIREIPRADDAARRAWSKFCVMRGGHQGCPSLRAAATASNSASAAVRSSTISRATMRRAARKTGSPGSAISRGSVARLGGAENPSDQSRDERD